jgi:hypothetical protein
MYKLKPLGFPSFLCSSSMGEVQAQCEVLYKQVKVKQKLPNVILTDTTLRDDNVT